MQQEKKVYMVSDLAENLGVPRTTINDWLNRYSAYLDSEQRGKRKVFTGSSLEVLRKIAALRSEGKNAFEIEKILAERFGVRPEVAPEPPQAVETPAGKGEMVIRDLGSELGRIAGEMQSLERRRSRLLGRSAFLLGLLLLAIAGTAGAGTWFCLRLTDTLRQQEERVRNDLASLQANDRSVRDVLRGGNEQIRQLKDSQDEAREQTRQAEERWAKSLQDMQTQQQAQQKELQLLRQQEEERSARNTEMLRELENSSRAGLQQHQKERQEMQARLEERIRELQQQLEDQKKAGNQLQKELNAQKERCSVLELELEQSRLHQEPLPEEPAL